MSRLMNKEVEVKILDVESAKIEESLKRLGAEKVFDGTIQTLFLDFSDGRISRGKNVLRLRNAQEKTELTYKKVVSTQEVKTAEEFSVEVSNLETTRKILENLKLTVTESMTKQRISYILNDARFDLDCYTGEYSHIPEFLEIEAESIQNIHKYASELGFSPKDCLTWSTNELVNHYKKKK